jgi:hypothetical protein
LPAIGGTPKKRRARSRLVSTFEDENNEPFDVSDLVEQVDGMVDADGRHWPRLPDAPRNRIKDLENTVENQRKELSTRCIQIADDRPPSSGPSVMLVEIWALR